MAADRSAAVRPVAESKAKERSYRLLEYKSKSGSTCLAWGKGTVLDGVTSCVAKRKEAIGVTGVATFAEDASAEHLLSGWAPKDAVTMRITGESVDMSVPVTEDGVGQYTYFVATVPSKTTALLVEALADDGRVLAAKNMAKPNPDYSLMGG